MRPLSTQARARLFGRVPTTPAQVTAAVMAAMAFVPRRPMPVTLRAVTPVADEGLRAHVKAALAHGHLELGPTASVTPRQERLTIIANGPSAINAPLHGSTLALNGAIKLFHNTGRVPTFWAATDPQALVANFLDQAPLDTTYLVGSYCHPDVFSALQGRNVIVWHVNGHATYDLVEGRYPLRIGPSISCMAMELGERLGFSGLDFWGWDGCYGDAGQDHAIGQAHSRHADVQIKVGDRWFNSTRTWGLEGESMMTMLTDTPRDLVIHGDGMFRAQLELLRS